MQFLNRSWAQVRSFMGKLSIAERWLMVALLVLGVLAVYIVLTMVGKPEMTAISGFASDRQGEVLARLQQSGIAAEDRNGVILVPTGQQIDTLVILQRSDLMNANTSAAFDDLITKQNPWMTDRQNQQAFLVAKQKVLGLVLGKMAGVRNAEVILSVPEDKGFGRTSIRPSAAVNVTMQAGKRIDKPMVEAIAGLVAGAVAGMKAQEVTVVDALAGRQYTVKSGMDQWPSETMELVQQLEDYKRHQIQEVLGYIPGVIVAVNVLADPTRSKQIEQVEFEKTEPLRRERSRETQRRDSRQEGAPGARSNNGLDIEASGADKGSHESTNEAESEFGPKQPVRKVSAVEVGHTVQQVNVTVNVPRSYFVALFKQGKADAAEPDDATLLPFAQDHLARIESQVQPLISSPTPGVVKAHLIPDRATLVAASLAPGTGGIEGGVGAVLESDWAKPAGLALMAAACLAIMLGMVRKATQAPPLPTAQELAGLPPTLPNDDELVGEADESVPTMPGREVDETEMHHRKIAEQIAEMIKSNPTESAQLVRKWVRTDE